MGRQLIYWFTILVLLSSTLLVVRLLNSDEYEAEKKIFFSRENGFVFNRLVNKLPLLYFRLYEEAILENSKNYMLVVVKDRVYNDFSYIVLKDKKNKKSNLVIGHLGLIHPEGEIDCINYERHLIDINNFNKYIKISGIDDKQTIVDKVLLFVHYQSVSDGLIWRKIESLSDLSEIPSLSKDMDFISDRINIDSLKQEISFDNKNYSYVWYQCCGLIRFEYFISERNKLMFLKSKFIGFFGNEMLPYHSLGCR